MAKNYHLPRPSHLSSKKRSKRKRRQHPPKALPVYPRFPYHSGSLE